MAGYVRCSKGYQKKGVEKQNVCCCSVIDLLVCNRDVFSFDYDSYDFKHIIISDWNLGL